MSASPASDAVGGRGHARRTARLAGTLLRDDVATLLVFLQVVSAVCWAADWSTAAVGASAVASLGLVLLTGAVVVTRLVPHVAAGGRRVDLEAALLVRTIVVVVVLTSALVALDLLRKDPPGVVALPSTDGPVVDALLLHAPQLALVAATGGLLGAGALRWGTGAPLRLSALALPLLCFEFTTSTRSGLLLWVAVTVAAALTAHLLLRSTPLRPDVRVCRARIGVLVRLLPTRLERGAPA